MGQVAVVRLHFLEVQVPLLELAVPADAVGRQEPAGAEQLAPELGVHPQPLGRFGRVREQVAEEGDVLGARHRHLGLAPSGGTNSFSVETEGAVTRRPWPSGTSQSRPNSAAPFISG